MNVTTAQPEQLEPTAAFRRVYLSSLYVGGAGLLISIFLGYAMDQMFARFFHAYLVSFSYFLSLSLGALWFVLIQHVTRAGWSVGVRRTAETLACVLPMMAALSAPIVLSVVLRNGDLYDWTAHAPAGAADAHHFHGLKHVWLNPFFFLIRLAIYFATWAVMGIWYWRQSVRQDTSGDPALTVSMQRFAPICIVIYALTVTFASFDLLMTLDPHWFSTIFGVYYFAGSAVGVLASLIVILAILQARGYVTATITTEHYHDLGKLLFAFTFFWGYIAFSQYMLLWYANIPEEIGWYVIRGASTAAPNEYSPVVIVLLFGHLLIPFVGLMSRHVKRRRGLLVFWAIWMLVFHWLDIYWLVMPALDGKFHLGLIELLCFVGIGGVYVATAMRIAMQNNLRPIADPRLGESLVFENI